MEDLFRSYWWLIFPIGYLVFGGVQSVINYYRHKNVLALLKTYADTGREPPAELLKALDGGEDRRRLYGRRCENGRNGSWFSVVLFGVMALGFAYASWSDLYSAHGAFRIVAFVLGALALASLVSALTGRDRNQP